MVRNLPRAFFTALCGSLVYNFAGVRDTFALFTENHERVLEYTSMDLVFSVFVGVFMGLAGAVFVSIISHLSVLRNRFLRFALGPKVIARRRFIIVLVASALLAPIIYLDVVYGIHGGDKPLTDYMFQSNHLGLSLPLLVYVPFKFLATTICVSLPLPVGLFTPTFITGGALGRVIGEAMALSQAGDFGVTFEPWEFAVLGAAAFSSGVTRAISTAVIVFELSGQDHLRLPMSVAILAAYFVGNRFSKGIYDVILDTNGTPYLPELPAELYMIPAFQVLIWMAACGGRDSQGLGLWGFFLVRRS
jgi:chloride channel 2